MRNIAILEWGPSSLYHMCPRCRIKVRTAWLEGGPVMPPFLSTKEEAKTKGVVVRYALSAFEDLNSVIRNLRECFGFPYPESVGYLNTLTKSHRVRREHEVLVDRLRQWAIFGNVDAVVWIDYEKANQRSGSFKVGPRDSRPFSKAHMERCTAGAGGHSGADDHEGAESDWSGSEDEEGGGAPTSDAAAERHGRSVHSGDDPALLLQSSLSVRQGGNPAIGVAASKKMQESVQLAGGTGLNGTTPRFQASTPRAPAATMSVTMSQISVGGPPASPGGSAGGAGASPQMRLEATRALQDKDSVLRMSIQEEVCPPYGCIYPRSITPGPGHYGNPGAAALPVGSFRSFGYRPRGRIDTVMAAAKLRPGPGEYGTTPGLSEVEKPYGRFGLAEKMVEPTDIPRKLPFISPQAAEREGYGVHGPSGPQALRCLDECREKITRKEPLFSFGKARRPF